MYMRRSSKDRLIGVGVGNAGVRRGNMGRKLWTWRLGLWRQLEAVEW